MLLRLRDEDQITITSPSWVGFGEQETCVFSVAKKTRGSDGLLLWDSDRTYFYEAGPTGWIEIERPTPSFQRGFLIFEPGESIPLYWTTRPLGNWFDEWRLQRWNPRAKLLEAAQPKDLKALKRYIGLSVVMARLDFAAGVQAKLSGRDSGVVKPDSTDMITSIAVETRGSIPVLSDLLGEPLLQDINKPMADFSPHKASDAALAMALLDVNAQFRQYDRAVFSRRKGGPILGAIGGPSLNAFNNQALQNGIEIARELTRRYPQAADGWWVLAKMAEWAIHKRQGVKRVLGDPTNGLMPNPSKEGMRALERFFELKGWAGKSQYARALPFDPDGRFATEREYWDHRYTHELYARLRDKTIDPEALGKHFGTRPNATDALAIASPELSSFRP
jgi:hypothetical protein